MCKDGSCSSIEACRNALIPLVANSCKGGIYACWVSPRFQGKVGSIVNSCTGSFSCENLGAGGEVGDVEDSCNGLSSCSNSGFGGSVGSLKKSCNAEDRTVWEGGRC